MQLQDYQLQVQELVHDLANIDYSAAELTGYVNNARNRVALDFHCVRYLFQNSALIGGQEQYPIAGGISGVNVTTAGHYTTAPSVTFSAPPAGGVQATGVAVLNSAGGVAQVNMTNWGSGYAATLAAPVTVTFGAGTPTAAGVVNVHTNIFDINSISVLWGTQRYTLGWLPFSPFQAFCRANPTLQRQPAVWAMMQEINTLFIYPIPDQPYLADIDAIGLPLPLVNPTDVDTQVLLPPADCVQFYAAHLALLKLQNFEQAEYMHKKYKARMQEVQSTRQDRRIPNIYRNYQRRIARW
jgi:hypothetical protein